MANRDSADRETLAREDMDEGLHVGWRGIDEDEDLPKLQAHQRHHPHDRAHVSLTQDEYTAEEAARLLGTTIENIVHAVRSGDLKAERAGSRVVCIQHADLVDWLKRGGGV